MNKIPYPLKASKTKMYAVNLPKRVFDVSASLILLLCLSPFLLLFSILLLLFSGRPIFFKQMRTGQYDTPFTIWKFRTMEDDENRLLTHQYHWKNGVPYDFVFETPAHQRITKIGKVYRKLSIDELPQLFNVLCGHMSLVGPRPEIPGITCLYSHHQSRRLQVKPGITGYAQVNGRSINTHGEKIAYDLFYIENQSFSLDMKVLLKTVGLVIRGKGAW